MKDDMDQALSDLEQVLEQKKIETQDLEEKLVQTDGENKPSFHMASLRAESPCMMAYN